MTTLRVEVLQALYDHRAGRTTAQVGRELAAQARGISEEDIKYALDGLLGARMVVWEARGEHFWRISAQGQNYLAASD